MLIVSKEVKARAKGAKALAVCANSLTCP